MLDSCISMVILCQCWLCWLSPMKSQYPLLWNLPSCYSPNPSSYAAFLHHQNHSLSSQVKFFCVGFWSHVLFLRDFTTVGISILPMSFPVPFFDNFFVVVVCSPRPFAKGRACDFYALLILFSFPLLIQLYTGYISCLLMRVLCKW